MTMMPELGPLVGMGESGYVFEIEGQPDQVLKLVQIRPGDEFGNPRPFRETFPRPTARSRKIARNELQANLFARLVNVNFNNHLPMIYDFGLMRGGSDLQSQIYDSYQKYGWETSAWNAMLREFSGDNRAAWWVMERIPYMVYNNWGGNMPETPIPGWTSRDYEKFYPKEQAAYEDLTHELLSEASVILRDTKNPANMGYREDGTAVWFDPTVSTWPITRDMRDSNRLLDREKYDLFADAFGVDQINRYQQAIDDGSYFRERHGIGALMAEGDL
ncbi:MAG: hypothetical protein ACTSPB_25190 [Candidatus Thorarchaeota archaeon]